MAYEDELAKVPLFSQLERKDLARLGKTVVPRSYAEGKEIVKEGEQAVAFFVIVRGKVAVTKGGKQLAVKSSGDYFGDMALLDGYPRSTSVVALEETDCLAMTHWDFNAELRTNPSMAQSLLRALSKIIRRLEGEDIP